MQESIDHIAAACYASGIREVVICPGSRNAPLIIAFVRSGLFNCVAVPDERSAGFIALGKAIASQNCVALICTSGSAVANFYPAVLEAYYQQVPLLVLSADRPPELIDQWDGQTIRQEFIFGTHTRGFYQLPDQYEDPGEFARITVSIVQLANQGLRGPVHLNVPLREPLYPEPDRIFSAGMPLEPLQPRIPATEPFDLTLLHNKKVLVVRGMNSYRNGSVQPSWAVHEDLFSGIKGPESIPEQIFYSLDEGKLQALRPDVLLTDGTAILSKTIRQYLRRFKPQQHFHFSLCGDLADPFLTEPVLIKSDLDEILGQAAELQDIRYPKQIKALIPKVRETHSRILDTASWNEFSVIHHTLKRIPNQAVIHSSNSMPVRYLAYLAGAGKQHEVYANRGTSGIDGCVSTALGFASLDPRPNYLFCGDLAFFYDSNAFWNQQGKEGNLKVILLNNRGGGIFRLLDGASNQPELTEWFETRHSRTADELCRNLGLGYFRADSFAGLEEGMDQLSAQTGPAVLELFTDPEENQTFFKHYKTAFYEI